MTNIPTWQAHCDIAVGLKRRFDTPTALDYLVGEKFISFMREAAMHDDLKAQIPLFADGIRQRFEPWELEGWFAKERKPARPETVAQFEDPAKEAGAAASGFRRMYLLEDAAKWLLA